MLVAQMLGVRGARSWYLRDEGLSRLIATYQSVGTKVYIDFATKAPGQHAANQISPVPK